MLLATRWSHTAGKRQSSPAGNDPRMSHKSLFLELTDLVPKAGCQLEVQLAGGCVHLVGQ